MQLEKRIEQLKKSTPYKKDAINKYIKQIRFLTEPMPKEEHIKKVIGEFGISKTTIDQHLRILKHDNVGWVTEYKGEYDIPYLKLTYKFYEDIKDIIDQFLPKKYIESEKGKQDELSKELKKFIEKHLTPEGFDFDINEVDYLSGMERIVGAYFRNELLNNPYKAIRRIYIAHYGKYYQYKPIHINITLIFKYSYLMYVFFIGGGIRYIPQPRKTANKTCHIHKLSKMNMSDLVIS